MTEETPTRYQHPDMTQDFASPEEAVDYLVERAIAEVRSHEECSGCESGKREALSNLSINPDRVTKINWLLVQTYNDYNDEAENDIDNLTFGDDVGSCTSRVLGEDPVLGDVLWTFWHMVKHHGPQSEEIPGILDSVLEHTLRVRDEMLRRAVIELVTNPRPELVEALTTIRPARRMIATGDVVTIEGNPTEILAVDFAVSGSNIKLQEETQETYWWTGGEMMDDIALFYRYHLEQYADANDIQLPWDHRMGTAPARPVTLRRVHTEERPDIPQGTVLFRYAEMDWTAGRTETPGTVLVQAGDFRYTISPSERHHTHHFIRYLLEKNAEFAPLLPWTERIDIDEFEAQIAKPQMAFNNCSVSDFPGWEMPELEFDVDELAPCTMKFFVSREADSLVLFSNSFGGGNQVCMTFDDDGNIFVKPGCQDEVSLDVWLRRVNNDDHLTRFYCPTDTLYFLQARRGAEWMTKIMGSLIQYLHATFATPEGPAVELSPEVSQELPFSFYRNGMRWQITNRREDGSWEAVGEGTIRYLYLNGVLDEGVHPDSAVNQRRSVIAAAQAAGFDFGWEEPQTMSQELPFHFEVNGTPWTITQSRSDGSWVGVGGGIVRHLFRNGLDLGVYEDSAVGERRAVIAAAQAAGFDFGWGESSEGEEVTT